MTLEDFFTLSELKDGLTAPERVNELITIMQKEKDTVVKSLRETTRQWSAVAKTIAATESKNCLDNFIALDGLGFIDKWLNDAQSLEKDPTNSFLEESIIELLRAVAKLQIDGQKSLSSGIGRTVQNLVAHSSAVVRDAAKTLCDAWMVNHDNDISHSHGNANDKNNAERVKDETMSFDSKDATRRMIIVKETTTPDKVTDTVTVNQETIDPSCTVTHDDRNLLGMSEVSGSKSEAELVEQSNLSRPSGQEESMAIHDNNDNDENNAAPFKDETMSLESADATQQTVIVKETTTPDKVTDMVTVNQEMIDPSCEITLDDQNILVKSEVSGSKSEAELVEKSNLIASSVDVNNVLEPSMKTDPRDEKDEDTADDDGSPDDFQSTTVFSMRNQAGVSASQWEEAESPKSSSSSESEREADDAKEDAVQSNKNLRNGSLDMELDYGMIDPLEVARQVANEVELEVDSREQSCSTSEKISGGEIERPSTPDSMNRKESMPIGGADKEDLPSATEPVKETETLVSQRRSCKPDITVSQSSELAQESEANAEKGFSGFDLNQEICSEEVDNPINPVSSAISVVSASRAAAVTGSFTTPLQFEGSLAWKGSASTSAFRRIHNNSKQRLDFLDIDLNVAEDNDDKIDNLESFVEASSMRPERPQLELNSIGYDGVDGVSFDWRRDGRVASVSQNGWQSPSRSSSSSKQPSARKFDLNLNDQTVFPNGVSLEHNPYVSKLSKQSSTASGGALKQQESVISIFGTKVEVQSKDSLPRPSKSLMPTMNFNFGGAGSGLGLGSSMHYGNPSLYGHTNGFPSGAAMFFTTPTYGSHGVPIPYMADSRGAPVVPQMMGSSPTPPIGIAQPTPPFVMNMGHMAAAGTSSGSNGLDLNTSLMFDGGNREAMRGLQQLFPHASSSPIVGEKRREPDGGWEFFPVNKHHQPSWR